MLNQIFPFQQGQYKQLNILIVEPDREQANKLAQLIKLARPNHKVLVIESLEQIFSLICGEVEIDIIFFDIETEANTDNINLIKAVVPEISLIHWSRYQHPEVIELLYCLGVNSFCTKESDSNIIIEAVDLAGNYPQSLYVDKQLHDCLPLLKGY